LSIFRLHHITNGYWKIVKEFTTKGAVREIERLANVATDLGRGKKYCNVTGLNPLIRINNQIIVTY